MAVDSRPALLLVGRLEAISLADLLQVLAAGEQDGVLTIQDDESGAVGEIELRFGKVVRASAQPAGGPSGSILVRSHAVSPSCVGEAPHRQAAVARRRALGELLIETGALEPRLLQRSLLEQLALNTAVILGWRRGVFRFRRAIFDGARRPEPAHAAVALEPHELVLEAARLTDEAHAAAAG